MDVCGRLVVASACDVVRPRPEEEELVVGGKDLLGVQYTFREEYA